jgi:hypothetical protein
MLIQSQRREHHWRSCRRASQLLAAGASGLPDAARRRSTSPHAIQITDGHGQGSTTSTSWASSSSPAPGTRNTRLGVGEHRMGSSTLHRCVGCFAPPAGRGGHDGCTRSRAADAARFKPSSSQIGRSAPPECAPGCTEPDASCSVSTADNSRCRLQLPRFSSSSQAAQ